MWTLTKQSFANTEEGYCKALQYILPENMRIYQDKAATVTNKHVVTLIFQMVISS